MNQLTSNQDKLLPREDWETVIEGKTKVIYLNVGIEHAVVMKNKPDITADDGQKHDTIEGKAEASTTITANVFQALDTMGISTHFQEKISDTEILVDDCDMIPLECIFRHVVTGSYLKRQREILGDNAPKDGTILQEPIMEFNYKNDVILEDGTVVSDPLMQCDESGMPEVSTGKFILLHPATGELLSYSKIINPSTGEELSDEKYEEEKKVILEHAREIRSNTVEVGERLQRFYAPQGLGVWDGKIEFGKRKKDGKLVVADVIDGDSIRLRDALVVRGNDRKLYIGNNVDRQSVIAILTEKYFQGLVGALADNDIEHAQKILLQIEDKFISTGNPLPRNEEGSYSTDKGTIESLLAALDLMSREQLKPIRDYVVTRIIEAEGLDKQGYRDGESAEETLSKYQRLAQITDELINKLVTIDGTLKSMNNRTFDVLGRPD